MKYKGGWRENGEALKCLSDESSLPVKLKPSFSTLQERTVEVYIAKY